MKIQVIQKEFKSHGSYSKAYKICNCEYCCEEIKHIPNIDFNFGITENTDNPIEEGFEPDKDLGVMLINNIYHEPCYYDDFGYTEDYYYKLNYCPICGKKIEIEIIDNIEVTSEYENLVKEREDVHNKFIKTDSIKKQNEYLKRRQELDREINNFYYTDSLPHKGEANEDY